MGKIAFVFPGQGAQAVGMGKDAYDAFDISRSVIDRADEALGFNLSEIIFNGPEEVAEANSQYTACAPYGQYRPARSIQRSRHQAGFCSGAQPWRIQRTCGGRRIILRGCRTHGTCSRAIHGASRTERTRGYGSRTWCGA